MFDIINITKRRRPSCRPVRRLFIPAKKSTSVRGEKSPYEWALAEMKILGIPMSKCDVIRMEFDGGDTINYDTSEVFVCVFPDPTGKKALRRREWVDLIDYEIINNYQECLKVAPRTTKSWVKAGIELARKGNSWKWPMVVNRVRAK